MHRLGLCCLFRTCSIHFTTTTARYAGKLRDQDLREYLSKLITGNIQNLIAGLQFCHKKSIGSFRITSRFFPLYTHPKYGYTIDDLPDCSTILEQLEHVKKCAQKSNIRLTVHPDQFVVLNSPNPDVVHRSTKELEYHGLLADLLGIDVITVHGGGGYGNKRKALERLEQRVAQLSSRVRSRLTLENDDKLYSPEELFPICKRLCIPLVYDVHHHRCLQTKWTVEQATEQALTTWDREPLFHISSPLGGWRADHPEVHANYIAPSDVPLCWAAIDPLTVEIEAKAKELAIFKLRPSLIQMGWNL